MTDAALESFSVLKSALVSAAILSVPDYSKPFRIECDASGGAIGAVLCQGEGMEEKVIAFMSQKLTGSQKKYHVSEKECLAVVKAIEQFRHYIEGSHFVVVTDHQALTCLNKVKDPYGRLARWALKLGSFDFEVVYKKGSSNVVPDALSRIPETTISSLEFLPSDSWYIKMKQNVESCPKDHPKFRVHDCRLQFRNRIKTPDDSLEWKNVVPESCRLKILGKYHDSPSGCHFGISKTSKRIGQFFFWPGMYNDVRKYISKCEVCKRSKSTNRCEVAPMGAQKPADYPFQVISLDFVTHFPRSKDGNCVLLVATDWFSKLVVAKPYRAANAKVLVQFFREEIKCRFGIPEIVVTDNGKQFISQNFTKLLSDLNIKHWKNSFYHPKANPTERTNRIIGTTIRCYLGTDQREWDLLIPEIVCAINTSVHESTKFTPFYLNYGREMRSEDCTRSSSDEKDRERALEKLSKMREVVKENIRKAYETSKSRYDLRTRVINYSVGEIVWRKNFALSDASKNYCAKLGPLYIKCKVVRKMGSNTYLLEDVDTGKTGAYSTEAMKKN